MTWTGFMAIHFQRLMCKYGITEETVQMRSNPQIQAFSFTPLPQNISFSSLSSFIFCALQRSKEHANSSQKYSRPTESCNTDSRCTILHFNTISSDSPRTDILIQFTTAKTALGKLISSSGQQTRSSLSGKHTKSSLSRCGGRPFNIARKGADFLLHKIR